MNNDPEREKRLHAIRQALRYPLEKQNLKDLISVELDEAYKATGDPVVVRCADPCGGIVAHLMGDVLEYTSRRPLRQRRGGKRKGRGALALVIATGDPETWLFDQRNALCRECNAPHNVASVIAAALAARNRHKSVTRIPPPVE